MLIIEGGGALRTLMQANHIGLSKQTVLLQVLLDNWSHLQQPQKPKALLLLTLRVAMVLLINPSTPSHLLPILRPCNIPLNPILYGFGVLLGVTNIEARCFLLPVSVFHCLDLPPSPFPFSLSPSTGCSHF